MIYYSLKVNLPVWFNQQMSITVIMTKYYQLSCQSHSVTFTGIYRRPSFAIGSSNCATVVTFYITCRVLVGEWIDGEEGRGRRSRLAEPKLRGRTLSSIKWLALICSTLNHTLKIFTQGSNYTSIMSTMVNTIHSKTSLVSFIQIPGTKSS